MFKGIATALITPLKKDLSIDWELFKTLCLEQDKLQVPALFIHGTTGCGSTLTMEEKIRLLNVVHENVSSKCLIFTSISNNNTLSAIAEIEQIKQFASRVDGMLLLTPYYNKANEEGMYQHLIQITKSANLPTILYHIPGRCGVGISSKVLIKLYQEPLIVGIKYADNNIGYLQEILLNYQNKDFAVYLGEDNLYYSGMKLGVDGLISASTNILLKEYQQISLNDVNSKQRFLNILPLVNALFREVNPICITYLYANKHNKKAYYRLPLCQPSKQIRQLLVTLGDQVC